MEKELPRGVFRKEKVGKELPRGIFRKKKGGKGEVARFYFVVKADKLLVPELPSGSAGVRASSKIPSPTGPGATEGFWFICWLKFSWVFGIFWVGFLGSQSQTHPADTEG